MMELTILMPCLNEAETLEICIKKAMTFLDDNQLDGEVLISDNGSTDGSVEIAQRCGARVVYAEQKGYGAALIEGSKQAYGKYVIMGDADDSYDFSNLMPFIQKLREGYDLVMGNRFAGGIEPNAMPWLHRYIGNPVLSFIGRVLFKSNIRDFHCGLRGYNKESIQKLGLHTLGMEYASEMVAMAELNHLKITEVPTTLKKDGRSRPPHLRSFRDGWRHLKFLLMYAPNWLFLFPGLLLLVLGGIGSATLFLGEKTIFNVTFSIHTFLYMTFMAVVGILIINMFFLIKLYAYQHEYLPRNQRVNWNDKLKEDKFIGFGILIALVGFALAIYTVVLWHKTNYSDLNPEIMMCLAIPAVALMVVGILTFFTGFLIGIIKIK